MKRIAIYVITYNQEDVIRRSLDSILCQKEWGLYRVVVSDDCSKDRTWSILQEYKNEYPEIIEIHRNEHNLGIYPNIQKATSYLPESDLYGTLAGDDAYCNGYFEAIQRFLKDNGIDTTEAIGIYSDWKAIDPSGDEIVHKQEIVKSGVRLWSLKARGLISKRSLLWSKKVFDNYEAMLTGCGLNLIESHYDSQVPLNIKAAYYMPQVTTIYYAGIGVSKRLADSLSAYNTTENIEKWNYGIDHYVQDERDMNLAKYNISRSEYFINPKWSDLFKMYSYYKKSQLPIFRDSFKKTLLLFLSLAKYKISFKKKN